VLTAIDLEPEYSKGALRVTFGEFNRKWEVDFLIDALKEIVPTLK
jgi:cysteine sulfinate desulfinase/cysteine desulfurase-like protein